MTMCRPLEVVQHGVVAAPRICMERERERKGREEGTGKKEKKEKEKRGEKGKKGRGEQARQMYHGCKTPLWNCQKIMKDTEREGEKKQAKDKQRNRID